MPATCIGTPIKQQSNISYSITIQVYEFKKKIHPIQSFYELGKLPKTILCMTTVYMAIRSIGINSILE